MEIVPGEVGLLDSSQTGLLFINSDTPIAIAFGYFELLLRSNNVDIINREWARLVSLGNLLKSFELNEYVYEDFAAETFEVFRVISDCTLKKDHDPLTKLVRIFNTSSDSIIAYLKVYNNRLQ